MSKTEGNIQTSYHPTIFDTCAAWKEDCQGKWDYDGRIIDVSSRYWPGRYRQDGRPSATSEILLRYGNPILLNYEFGNSLTLAEREFVADTEEVVKLQVMQWVSEQRAQIIGLVWGHLVEASELLKPKKINRSEGSYEQER